MKFDLLTIDDLGKLDRGRSRNRPRDDQSLYGGLYPFIQTGDVKHAPFYITSYIQTYNEKGLAQSKLWKRGTLCITIAANIADTAILAIDACFPDSILGFTSYKEKSNVKFVKYCFDVYKTTLEAISKGTTQDNLSLDKLRKIKFRIPNPTIQLKIAAVLSTYDDLIENNNHRIAILEKMAEELYREWFVRLRFPGHEKVKIIKGVPEGWCIKRIGSTIKHEKGKNPEILSDEKTDDNDVYLNVDAIENGKYQYAPKFRAIICEKDETLMLMDGARSSIVFNGQQGIVSSTFSVVRTEKKYRAMLHEYFKANLEAMVSNNTGSAIPHANKAFIIRMCVKLPLNEKLTEKFNDQYQVLFLEKQNLKRKNTILATSRDRLLTRLMSGKIDIENLDIQFPDSMKEDAVANA
jgi:type I restriction enzyme S subunit